MRLWVVLEREHNGIEKKALRRMEKHWLVLGKCAEPMRQEAGMVSI